VPEKAQVNTRRKRCDLCKYLAWCPYSCPDKPPSAQAPKRKPRSVDSSKDQKLTENAECQLAEEMDFELAPANSPLHLKDRVLIVAGRHVGKCGMLTAHPPSTLGTYHVLLDGTGEIVSGLQRDQLRRLLEDESPAYFSADHEEEPTAHHVPLMYDGIPLAYLDVLRIHPRQGS
jgi:hypothetical protein